MSLLDGRNAVVTGASGGIGREIVQLFLDEGANVWCCDREGSLSSLSVDVPSGQWFAKVPLDLTDSESIKSAFSMIREQRVPVDILVNNAGIMGTALFQMTTLQSLEEQMSVNLYGAFYLTQLVSKLMVRHKSGTIINLASTVAIDATEGKAAYAASKAALEGMTRSVSKELGRHGIRANCVAPSIVNTSLNDQTTDEAKAEMVNRSALRRIAQPREIASVVLFLASDMASYVSGQTIRVDGGL